MKIIEDTTTLNPKDLESLYGLKKDMLLQDVENRVFKIIYVGFISICVVEVDTNKGKQILCCDIQTDYTIHQKA